MRIKFLLAVLLSSMIVMLSGCRTSPIHNIQDQSLVFGKSEISAEAISKSIVRAGSKAGWNMNANKSGHVLGTLYIKSHMAQVDIDYDSKKYSITYKNSTNLNYQVYTNEITDNKGNTHINKSAEIHRNYNKWVQQLDREIKAELSQL